MKRPFEVQQGMNQVHRSDTILFTTAVTISFVGHLMACTGITVSLFVQSC